MNCRKAAGLLHEYISNKLEDMDRLSLEQHLGACRNCRNELELTRRLEAEQYRQKAVKAPGNFTDNVMEALYRLPPEKRPLRVQDPADRWKLVYRRLGYSLILTAGIIMFSLFLPVAQIHPESISGKVQSSVESSGTTFKSIITGIDNGMMGVLKADDDSESYKKGGMDNGM